MTYGNITDVSGILVGHAVLPGGYRGCTVVIADGGAVAAVDVRGGAPGTRETDALNLGGLVGRVDAVLLTGGSAFGLAAADGVMRALEERGQGYAIGGARVPIVAAAVLFDLAVGDPSLRPRAEDGWRAVASATVGPFAFGNTGAGAGATVGKALGRERAVKGGLG
ncbi:MAG: P1 family peptidase, partial [Clostridia bacterium]|nr:P1 family peptidase [Clostridia bacterium]